MRTLFAVAVIVLVSTLKLAGQIIPPPTPRTAAVAQGGVTQGTGVYLVTFRPGTPASDKAAVVRATGARLRAAYNAINAASVDLPDASALARLRNDPRVLSVFENHKILLNVQGRGGSGASKPKPPENLSATAASSSRINLSWSDGANNEDGFAIERCVGSGCANFAEIFRVGANVLTYADSGLSAQTVYRYRVLAFNTAGTSKYSNTAQATTEAPPTPPP